MHLYLGICQSRHHHRLYQSLYHRPYLYLFPTCLNRHLYQIYRSYLHLCLYQIYQSYLHLYPYQTCPCHLGPDLDSCLYLCLYPYLCLYLDQVDSFDFDYFGCRLVHHYLLVDGLHLLANLNQYQSHQSYRTYHLFYHVGAGTYHLCSSYLLYLFAYADDFDYDLNDYIDFLRVNPLHQHDQPFV